MQHTSICDFSLGRLVVVFYYNHPANMFAMFADDELRHCAWTHPGKRQAKPATKLATAEHHCCSTSLLQLQQQQPLLNVTRRLQHNLKVQSQKSHRFRFGCATKIATALLGNMGGLAKKTTIGR